MVRVHPSFRFEERLAARIAGMAAQVRPAAAAAASSAAGGTVLAFPGGSRTSTRAAPRARPARPTRCSRPSSAATWTRPTPAPWHGRIARPAHAVRSSWAGRSRPPRSRSPASRGSPGARRIPPRDPSARAARAARSRRGSRGRAARWRPGRTRLMPMKFPSFRTQREAFPEKLWTRCPSCEEQLFNKQLEKSMNVCPSCGHHFRLSAPVRLGAAPGRGHVRGARPRASCPRIRWGSWTRRRTRTGWPPPSWPPACGTPPCGASGRSRAGRVAILRHGLRVHGRVDGCRGRREGRPGGRGGAGGARAAGDRVRLRWRPDAGGDAGADAARQDDGRPRAPPRGVRARTCR